MRREVELPLDIDRDGPVPIREQIVVQLRSAIGHGVLRVGQPMPSSRSLARSLGIARSTVLTSYLELEGEGWVSSRHGAGTFVTERPGTAARVHPASAPHGRPEPVLDMRPGDLDPSVMSMRSWRAAWRQIEPRAAPPPAAGDAELRDALATYLGAARGLRCDPSELVLCSGTNEALVVLGLAFGWARATVAVEDPGYPAVRAAIEAVGSRCVPFDVSEPSAVLTRLRELAPAPAAVYLTPSHQYPLGHRIEPGLRRDLVAWARESATLLIEDDYDAEFRFGVPPLPSMAALDQAADVIYLGTLSKTLDPGLRLSYLRVPPHLLEPVLRVRGAVGATTPWPVQQAVTELLRTGALARHIARIRRIYSDRRNALLSALEPIPAIIGISGIEAGLHVVARLKPGIDAAWVVDRARCRGVLIADLDEFRITPRPAVPALIFGYSKLDPTQLRRAIAIVAEIPALTDVEASRW
jgi:GntR family transcriptional regulator / MocR family aminotransferase